MARVGLFQLTYQQKLYLARQFKNVKLLSEYHYNLQLKLWTERRFISRWHVNVSYCVRVHVSIALTPAL